MIKKSKVLILSGSFLLTVSLLLGGYNVGSDVYASYFAQNVSQKINVITEEQTQNGSVIDGIPDYVLDPQRSMPEKTIDGINYIAKMEISALQAEFPVASSWDYALLKKTPCRYSGSAYNGSLVICAHNYRAFFKNLKNLNIGDEIILTDMDGNRFTYSVIATEVLKATAVDEIQNADCDLTLFTCTSDGKKRFAVRCERTV